jgi:hypothetical protein
MPADVGFGSLGDMGAHLAMSVLPPIATGKADIAGRPFRANSVISRRKHQGMWGLRHRSPQERIYLVE